MKNTQSEREGKTTRNAHLQRRGVRDVGADHHERRLRAVAAADAGQGRGLA